MYYLVLFFNFVIMIKATIA